MSATTVEINSLKSRITNVALFLSEDIFTVTASSSSSIIAKIISSLLPLFPLMEEFFFPLHPNKSKSMASGISHEDTVKSATGNVRAKRTIVAFPLHMSCKTSHNYFFHILAPLKNDL